MREEMIYGTDESRQEVNELSTRLLAAQKDLLSLKIKLIEKELSRVEKLKTESLVYSVLADRVRGSKVDIIVTQDEFQNRKAFWTKGEAQNEKNFNDACLMIRRIMTIINKEQLVNGPIDFWYCVDQVHKWLKNPNETSEFIKIILQFMSEDELKALAHSDGR